MKFCHIRSRCRRKANMSNQRSTYTRPWRLNLSLQTNSTPIQTADGLCTTYVSYPTTIGGLQRTRSAAVMCVNRLHVTCYMCDDFRRADSTSRIIQLRRHREKWCRTYRDRTEYDCREGVKVSVHESRWNRILHTIHVQLVFRSVVRLVIASKITVCIFSRAPFEQQSKNSWRQPIAQF